MSFGGGPALRLLLRLKLRGLLRKQARRMKTVKGLVFALIGGGLFVLWIGAILAQWLFAPEQPAAGGAASVGLLRLGALLVTVLSLASALTHRGLYVPGEEIELLFSAPVSRGDVVRYRLLVGVARAGLGALVLALLMMGNMPRPLFAFLGIFVAFLTLPLLSQIAAIAAGGLERVTFDRLKILRGLALPIGIAVGVGVAGLAMTADSGLGRMVRDVAGDSGLVDVANHPVARVLTAPFTPWANAVAATTWSGFGLWFGLSVLGWCLLYELAARLPIDFRELSLQTSSDVAERLRRMGRVGGGASGGKVSKRALGLGVPWILGRGPAGAVAWRKVGAILRKARGTLFVSAVVLIFVVFLSRAVFGREHDDGSRLGGQMMVAMLALLYLAGGLRFDFRDELDRMESIKAWPLSSRRVFFAMLLPEVLLISALIAVAVVVTAALAGGLGAFTVAVILALPPLVYAWVAVDNAVYLFAPVRVVPGQEGALQNAGRGMLLLMVRFTLLSTAMGAAGGLGFLAWFAVVTLFGAEALAAAAAFALGLATLVGVDLLLNELGALAFRRFDVAQDRG